MKNVQQIIIEHNIDSEFQNWDDQAPHTSLLPPIERNNTSNYNSVERQQKFGSSMPKLKLNGFKKQYEESSKQSISEMHGYYSPSKYNSNNIQKSLNQYKVEITHEEEVSNENLTDGQETEMEKRTNLDKQNSSNSNFNYNSGQ